MDGQEKGTILRWNNLENGILGQSAVFPEVDVPDPVPGIQLDQAALPGTQPKISVGVLCHAVDDVRSGLHRLERTVIVRGPQQPGSVGAEIKAVGCLAGCEDVIRTLCVVMQESLGTRGITRKSQFEVSDPYDVIPVNVQGNQVIPGERKAFVGFVGQVKDFIIPSDSESSVV